MAERQGFERELVDLGLDRTKEWFSEVERSGDRGGDQAYLVVVDGEESPITEGEYAFIQGQVVSRGKFSQGNRGCAYLGKINPALPFVFEVRDRVCAIRAGAFLNPDDPKIQYGGTWFDWTLVRDDKNPDRNFWPYYRQEMDDLALKGMEALGRGGVERFMQHEHITRRPIQIAKPFLATLNKVRIRAVPMEIRVGPFVRYTDYERTVVWLETVTPAIVRLRCKLSSGGSESAHYASTVRVGGRYFAAVEIDGLREETFYNYTVELAPLPAAGLIPVKPSEFSDVFPSLTLAVLNSIKDQLRLASLDENEWLTFRTLRRVYDKNLLFVTGSCRWYPGDKKGGKDWGPDMLDGLGTWLRANRKDKWPAFLFWGGDQIYADEIGDDTGEMIVRARFASRMPGPFDSVSPLRSKLIDGAWAGRFSHRYQTYKDPDIKRYQSVADGVKKLDEIHRRYPDIKGIYREYPDKNPREQLKERYQTLKNRRDLSGAHGEASDERAAREAVGLLPTVDTLEISTEPFRVFLPYWKVGFSTALRRNPMAGRYLSYNFLLWRLPDFEHQIPIIADRKSHSLVRKADAHGHPSAADGVHAADFAEFASLYERAWTSSRSVRVLLAQVPTFLMFDDHEVTDDWNFDSSWVRMLHNEKDDFRMWPKTLTDSLAAYWMYQGWCNKAPSQWRKDDPRVKALAAAQQAGSDALPELRSCIHKACFSKVPSKDPKATFQTGTSLDWHYQLPFDPPFLVPDCRTRKFMVPTDDDLRIIDHDNPKKRPMSQTIDNGQLVWMRDILVEKKRNDSVVFIAPSTPLLMPMKVTQIMTKPETAAGAWSQGGLLDFYAALTGSTGSGRASNALLRVFRRSVDLEHMIRDRSWRDLWGLVEAMRKVGSSVKTLVLVSGDVHHNYCMTGNLPGGSRLKPELLQVTCSGLQTTIRSSADKWVAEKQSSLVWNENFKMGKYTLSHGFLHKNPPGVPMGNPIGPSSISLYENAVAFVNVRMKSQVEISVAYLAGDNTYSYKYTSG
ncbi:hypothetical protein COMA1_11519 [Candidatus Nitrospira nitrosa]|uniref:DUF7800 domain-containing protein n=1 Tax=Candidatus Nitrospira nitrosa TaxID=1742972 RepID=A0A0S4LDY5_9BACT|nr:hypothetical protein COMA1_11519 [Candidatus Nitrospira nitrosa]